MTICLQFNLQTDFSKQSSDSVWKILYSQKETKWQSSVGIPWIRGILKSISMPVQMRLSPNTFFRRTYNTNNTKIYHKDISFWDELCLHAHFFFGHEPKLIIANNITRKQYRIIPPFTYGLHICATQNIRYRPFIQALSSKLSEKFEGKICFKVFQHNNYIFV